MWEWTDEQGTQDPGSVKAYRIKTHYVCNVQHMTEFKSTVIVHIIFVIYGGMLLAVVFEQSCQ